MILLDTNVISEWTKREPAVIAWRDRHVASRLFISAVTRAEIETGNAQYFGLRFSRRPGPGQSLDADQAGKRAVVPHRRSRL